ncbi:hypothetical protein QUG92_08250 [Curtobacterium sp. RHCKG23]|uniref:Uncharacterized protein n=1 Tax=Curtobacterium citri TaxID=3055139 RepID=A0ABT7T6V0_9MICO|nr:hypothetical protein [Curtobacterium citri]MDM7885094.1 hypothetical protein [Curtobacterium citri]
MQGRTTTTRRARRMTATLLAVLTALAAGVVVTGPVSPAVAATSEPEAADYATDVFGDAWDFSNAADINTSSTSARASVGGGALSVELVDQDHLFLVHSVSGSLPFGRDGALQPVDTAKYTRLSFSMDQPLAKRIGAVYWFTCREQTSACGGGATFSTVPGRHTYDIDLAKTSTLLGKRPWKSAKMVVVRLDPVVMRAKEKGGTASIDWVRLHAAPDAQHPNAALPPGTTGTTTIRPRPQTVVDSPNPSQGADLAAVQHGRSWDFRSAVATGGVRYQDITRLPRDSRGLNARNAPPAQNDPRLLFPVSPFPGSTYHYLQFDMTYDGKFDLADHPGGGKMARLIWNASGSGTPQISNDILTYDSGNQSEVTVDLTARNPLDENALNPRLGWAGRTITSLRLDPNEDPGAAVWHLRSLHLRADPAAKGSTSVQFHDAAWVPGTTAEVAVGTRPPGSRGYVAIAAKGTAVAKGANSVPFRLGSMAPGRYWVRVTLTHPDGSTSTSFAPAPVVMSR